MKPKRLYRTDAVVLRRQDFGEADRVLTLYSPGIGKFRALAKGVRRPKSRLGGHVEQFTHVNVLVAQGRTLDIVTQAEAVRPYPRIRDDLWKAAYASYVAELVDRFTEERLENQPIFSLLLEALAYLDDVEHPAGSGNGSPRPGGAGSAGGEAGAVRETTGAIGTAPPVELALRNFELRLLGHLGYAPELYRCVECGERLAPGRNGFSASGGGVLCEGCGEAQPGARALSVNAIKAMRLLSREPFGIFQRLRLAAETTLEIEGAVRAHVNYILERQLRTTEFLDRLKADRVRERRAS